MGEQTFKTVSRQEFQNFLGNPETILIDLRTPEETKEGKITPNAREIDFYDQNFKKILNILDKSKTYLVYCQHGLRSKKTLALMKTLGFKKAFDLKNGFSCW